MSSGQRRYRVLHIGRRESFRPTGCSAYTELPDPVHDEHRRSITEEEKASSRSSHFVAAPAQLVQVMQISRTSVASTRALYSCGYVGSGVSDT